MPEGGGVTVIQIGREAALELLTIDAQREASNERGKRLEIELQRERERYDALNAQSAKFVADLGKKFDFAPTDRLRIDAEAGTITLA